MLILNCWLSKWELVHQSTLFENILEGRRKKDNILSTSPRTLYNNEIHQFKRKSKFSELVHLSILFENILEGTQNKENIKYKDSFFSTSPHFIIMKYIRWKLFFFRTFKTCPPVHTFWKCFGGYKKERQHEIQRQLLVHKFALYNNEIHYSFW